MIVFDKNDMIWTANPLTSTSFVINRCAGYNFISIDNFGDVYQHIVKPKKKDVSFGDQVFSVYETKGMKYCCNIGSHVSDESEQLYSMKKVKVVMIHTNLGDVTVDLF